MSEQGQGVQWTRNIFYELKIQDITLIDPEMGIYLLKERVRDGFIVFIFKQSLIDNNKFTTTGESTTGGSSSRGMMII